MRQLLPCPLTIWFCLSGNLVKLVSLHVYNLLLQSLDFEVVSSISDLLIGPVHGAVQESE